MSMGVSPIVIRELYCSNGVWYVSGENFSPYCRVCTDEKDLETTYLSPWLLRLEEDPGSVSAADLMIQVVDKDRQVLSQTK